VEASLPHPLDGFVSTAFLNRMRARRDLPQTAEMASALNALRAAGLKAVASRLEPGGIMGGLSSETTGDGVTMFLSGFVIFREPDGYLASVTGPGNGSHDTPCKTLDEAARAVIDEYRRRGEFR
jgi:hypothetical protein